MPRVIVLYTHILSMPTLQVYPIDISYVVKDNRLQTLIFGRTQDNRTITVIDAAYTPHFYVLPKPHVNQEQLRRMAVGLAMKEKNQFFQVTQALWETVSYQDQKVAALKVHVNTPFAVFFLSKEFSAMQDVHTVLEADLRFRTQYLLANNITPLKPIEVDGEFIQGKYRSDYVVKANSIRPIDDLPAMPLRALAFRVETYSPQQGGLADEYPILFLSLYGDDFKRVVTYKPHQSGLEYVDIVKDEKELLLRFKELLAEYKPDVLVGYFSDGYDLPYLKTRANKHNVSFDIGIDYSTPKITKTTSAKRIRGIVHIDMFKVVKYVLAEEVATDSNALEEVAQKMLGETKIEMDHQALAHAWDHAPDELERFCQTSLFLTARIKRIFEKAQPRLTALTEELCIPLFDVSRAKPHQIAAWYAQKKASEYNVIIPPRPSSKVVKDRITPKQQNILDPRPGLFKDVALLDFRNLHAAIIAHHNIADHAHNANCSAEHRSFVPSEDGTWFCKNQDAFIPKIAGDLSLAKKGAAEMLRVEKNDASVARNWALKTIANNLSHLFVHPHSRWYSAACHHAASAFTQHYIRIVLDKAQEFGLVVLSSDQESMLLSMGKKDMLDAMEFVDKLNFLLPPNMDVNISAFYSKALVLPSKMGQRRLALLRLNGTCELKNINSAQRNWSPIARTTKEDVIKLILREDDLSIPVNYVRQVVRNLQQREVAQDDLIIYSQLQKDLSEYESQLPYVDVAHRMEALGIPVGPGSIIKYIIIPGDGRIHERARLPEEISPGSYDPDYYIRNQVLPAVANIFDVINVQIDEAIMPQNQQTLSHFFG